MKNLFRSISATLCVLCVLCGKAPGEQPEKITVIDATTGIRSQVVMSGDARITDTGAVTTTISKLVVTGINAKTTGVTVIGQTLTGFVFHPLFVVVDCTAASAITVAPSISVGTNSTNYDNILAITAATGVTAASKYLQINTATTANTSVASSQTIKVNVTTAATGTSMTMNVAIFGYYQ